MLLMTSSAAPAAVLALVVVVDDAYCVSHKKQAKKESFEGKLESDEVPMALIERISVKKRTKDL